MPVGMKHDHPQGKEAENPSVLTMQLLEDRHGIDRRNGTLGEIDYFFSSALAFASSGGAEEDFLASGESGPAAGKFRCSAPG